MLCWSLNQQLRALQKPQGLGSAVPAWEIHRANGSQVSQLRDEHEDFIFLVFGQMSPWWVLWVSAGNIFWSPGLWWGVSLGYGSWRRLLGPGVHWENVLWEGNRETLKARGWATETWSVGHFSRPLWRLSFYTLSGKNEQALTWLSLKNRLHSNNQRDRFLKIFNGFYFVKNTK